MIIDDKVINYFPWVKHDAQKHSRGRLAVFSGGELHTGAARLAANAGARIGAGWTVIYAPLDAARIIATHETSIMVSQFEYKDECPSDIERYNAIIIGPAFGLEGDRLNVLQAIAAQNIPIVLDADALTHISRDKELKEIVVCRQIPAILTPHSGEFERLFGTSATNLDDKIMITLKAAEKINAIIVHKGPETVIANPTGEFAVLQDSTPWLATAGTGDCLCGFIGGLMAQGLEPFKAAQLAVYLHAKCGEKFGAGLMAQDLPQTLTQILNDYAPDNLKASS